jgi:hypothetical protein
MALLGSARTRDPRCMEDRLRQWAYEARGQDGHRPASGGGAGFARSLGARRTGGAGPTSIPIREDFMPRIPTPVASSSRRRKSSSQATGRGEPRCHRDCTWSSPGSWTASPRTWASSWSASAQSGSQSRVQYLPGPRSCCWEWSSSGRAARAARPLGRGQVPHDLPHADRPGRPFPNRSRAALSGDGRVLKSDQPACDRDPRPSG